MSLLPLSWQRALGLAAPADGICNVRLEYRETTRYGNSSARVEDVKMRCVKPWGHKGQHYLEREGLCPEHKHWDAPAEGCPYQHSGEDRP